MAFIQALLDPAADPDVLRPVEARTHQQAGVPEDHALAWRFYTRWHVDPDYQLALRLQAAQPTRRAAAPVPVRFHLDQNTPNPFTETTEIQYTLAQAASVQLTVYTVDGRAVARLVDAWQQAGSYRLTWDARGFSSGVYLCRLSAGAFTTTRRMVLQQ